jgi:hypothetical protein
VKAFSDEAWGKGRRLLNCHTAQRVALLRNTTAMGITRPDRGMATPSLIWGKQVDANTPR